MSSVVPKHKTRVLQTKAAKAQIIFSQQEPKL